MSRILSREIKTSKWKLALSDFNLKFFHKEGNENKGPDIHSRIFMMKTENSYFNLEIISKAQKKHITPTE